jgi:hypothetical protein
VTRVARLLHLDDGESPALRAEIESKPLPATPAQKRPGWGRDMIAFLNAEAPVLDLRAADRTLGMSRPPAPKPFGPRVDRYAALELWGGTVQMLVSEYDAMADEVETLLAELAELAPFTAKAVAL